MWVVNRTDPNLGPRKSEVSRMYIGDSLRNMREDISSEKRDDGDQVKEKEKILRNFSCFWLLHGGFNSN